MLLGSLLSLVAPPLCVSCLGHAGSIEPLCGECRGALRWLGPEPVLTGDVEVWAPLAYEGSARPLVRSLKFRGASRLACTMAAQMVAGAPERLFAGAVLVPVPLAPARRRMRGYNQAERLAAALGRRTGLAVVDCLERSHLTGTQLGRDRAERLEAMVRRFAARPGAIVPREALLVDDVVTTGATLAACAEALRAAGAEGVRAVAYAHTPAR